MQFKLVFLLLTTTAFGVFVPPLHAQDTPNDSKIIKNEDPYPYVTQHGVKIGLDANFSAKIVILIQGLDSIADKLTGAAKDIAYELIRNLKYLMSDLNDILRDNVKYPLGGLGADGLNATQRINNMVLRLTNVLENPPVGDLYPLISGLQTIALELKDGLPKFLGGEKSEPRIDYFKFVNQKPSVVPKSGGHVMISGYNLWKSGQPAPLVEIIDPVSNKVVETPTPTSGSGPHSIFLDLSKDRVSEFTGRYFRVRVRPREKKYNKIWFVTLKRNGESVAADLNTFFAVPADYVLSYEVNAFVTFDTRVIETREMADKFPPKYVRFENKSANDSLAIDTLSVWEGRPHHKIVDVEVRVDPTEGVRNSSRDDVKVTVEGDNKIRLRGSLNKATTEEYTVRTESTFLIFKSYKEITRTRVKDTTVWKYILIPKVEYNELITPKDPKTASMIVPATIPATYVSLNVPIGPSEGNHRFWFTVQPIINGEKHGTIYKSATTAVNPATNGQTAGERFDAYMISGMYSVVKKDAEAEVRVTIETLKPGAN